IGGAYSSGQFAGDGGTVIAVGPSGNAYFAGLAHSRNFPTTSGAFQTIDNKASLPSWGAPFVAALNSTGTALIYSTFLDGGDPPNGGIGVNNINGIATDAQGNAYVAGGANSLDFPTTPGSFQPHRYGFSARGGQTAFVTKLNPSGSALVYSTFVGDMTRAGGIALDAQGSAYVTGSATFSDDFPAVNAIQSKISGGIMVKTADGGATLADSSSGLPASDGPRISTNPVPDPSDPSRLFVAAQTLSGGVLLRTT